MAEMVLAPSRGDGKEANFIQKFGRAFVRGDAFTKLSLLVWGLGYIGHGQLIKALLVTLVQGLGLYFLGTSGIPALKKFSTLGTVQMEMQFNPVTLKNEVNNYDNSFAILLLSVIALVVIVSLVVATMMVVQSNYLLQQQKAAGKKPNSFRQDINCYLNEKFYVTLLTLPVLGVVVFTIVPLFILIAVAFTNYDQQHMPPAALFTWVGLANFASLFGGQSLSMTFSYAFGKVLKLDTGLGVLCDLHELLRRRVSGNVHQQQKHEVPPALAYPVYDYHRRAAVRHAAAGAQFLLGCRYLQYHDE